MINIESNFDKTVDIKRLIDEDESGYIEGYADHLSDVPCHIQPLDDSYSQDIEGNFGKEWLMFCCYQDILEGDRVLGQNRHMELRIRRSNK